MFAPPPASSVPVVNPFEKVFVASLPLIHAVVRTVCRRYRVAPSDEADFASSVVLKLIDHDYAAFRQFRGGGLRAFLHVVVTRHLLDVRNREWGKWRPSRCATRLGSAAVYLEDLLYRQQIPACQAVQIVSNHPRWALSTTNVRGLHAQLPTRPPRVRRPESIDDVERLAPARGDAGHESRQDDAAMVRAALVMALRRLDSSERKLLRLRFQNGLTIEQIAAATGVEARMLYRQLPRVLARLREELRAQRLEGRDVSALLGHLGDELDSLLAQTWDTRGQSRAVPASLQPAK